MAKPTRNPPRRESVLLVTVAVDEEHFLSDVSRVLRVLGQAGYKALPSTREQLRLIGEDPDELPQFRLGLAHDPPPAA